MPDKDYLQHSKAFHHWFHQANMMTD